MEVKVFEALKAGNEALQALQRENSVEDVEKLMEDTAEAMAAQEVCSRSLSLLVTFALLCWVRHRVLFPLCVSWVLPQQQINSLLGGKLTAEDEEAAEKELAALQEQLEGPATAGTETKTVASTEPDEQKKQAQQQVPVAAASASVVGSSETDNTSSVATVSSSISWSSSSSSSSAKKPVVVLG